MILNPFKKLYNQNVDVFSIKEQGVYEKQRIKTELGRIEADIQPYSGGLAEKQYGYKSECRLRMFCDNNEMLKKGNYIEYCGEMYKIVYIAKWESGAEVLLNEIIV